MEAIRTKIRVTTLILAHLTISYSISTIILSCYNGQVPLSDQISPTKLKGFFHQNLKSPFTPARILFILKSLATPLITVVAYILHSKKYNVKFIFGVKCYRG